MADLAIKAFPDSDIGSQTPSSRLVTITPSNTVESVYILRGVYCGDAGDISVTTTFDTTHVFKNVAEGQIIGPFMIKRVNATGTTATNLIGFA